MKQTLGLLALGLLAGTARSQSKVFKEVNDEISSQIRIIKQDNALVGYLAFSQLEKASADSFNYRITIMDENLNDIGKVEFRDRWLSLGAVAFESDVLCLGMFKSNVVGKAYKNKKDFAAVTANTENAVVTRFLNLEGKTLATNTIPVEVETSMNHYGDKTVRAGLTEGIQLVNVPGKGFACYYGEEGAGQLVAFDTKGAEKWKRGVPGNAGGHYLLGAPDAAYLLTQAKGEGEGGFDIKGFGFADNAAYDKYDMKDKSGNSLKLLGFDVDASTGKPYVTGLVINPDRDGIYTVRDATKMPYIGVFTVHLNGPKKTDRKETFSYWQSGQQDFISEKGKLTQTSTLR